MQEVNDLDMLDFGVKGLEIVETAFGDVFIQDAVGILMGYIWDKRYPDINVQTQEDVVRHMTVNKDEFFSILRRLVDTVKYFSEGVK